MSNKYNGEIFKNGLAKLVDVLDDLPYPDRELLYEADPSLAEVGLKSFIAGRGCPYKCSYCFNKQYSQARSFFEAWSSEYDTYFGPRSWRTRTAT